jgi:hypothetical protein
MYRLWDWPRVYQWLSTALLFAALVTIGIWIPTGEWGTGIFFGALVLFCGLMVEGGVSINYDYRRRNLEHKRGMFLRSIKIDVTPEGEYVKIAVRKRHKDYISCDERRFHAEDQAEAAHDFVAASRAWEPEVKATSEAKALAEVLAKP